MPKADEAPRPLLAFSRNQTWAALLYVVEAEDLEQASEAYQNSTLPIDMEHRQVMKQVLGNSVPLELLYDCTLEKRRGDIK